MNLPAPLSKTCSRCLQELPIKSFDVKPSHRGGRRHICRKCRTPNHRATQVKWAAKNRARLSEYSKKWRASKKPPVPICSEHPAATFIWNKSAWHCRTCRKAASKAREWALDRQQRITRNAKAFETEYGPRFAAAYLALLRKHPKKSTNVRLVEIIRTLLPAAYRKFRIEAIERIYQMNRLSNLPIWNIGWTCQCCATYSADFRFFDLDHVTPAHKGGHGRRDNLQVLCPNCHRRKTICDLYGSILDPDSLQAADPLREPRNAEIRFAPAHMDRSGTSPVETGQTQDRAFTVPQAPDPTRPPTFSIAGESPKPPT